MNPLVTHYMGVVRLIESRALAKTPKLIRPAGMPNSEVREMAELLARGHEIYDRMKAEAGQ